MGNSEILSSVRSQTVTSSCSRHNTADAEAPSHQRPVSNVTAVVIHRLHRDYTKILWINTVKGFLLNPSTPPDMLAVEKWSNQFMKQRREAKTALTNTDVRGHLVLQRSRVFLHIVRRWRVRSLTDTSLCQRAFQDIKHLSDCSHTHTHTDRRSE